MPISSFFEPPPFVALLNPQIIPVSPQAIFPFVPDLAQSTALPNEADDDLMQIPQESIQSVIGSLMRTDTPKRKK